MAGYFIQRVEPAMMVIASAPDFVGSVLQSTAAKSPSDDFFLFKVRSTCSPLISIAPNIVLYASEACLINASRLHSESSEHSLGVGGEGGCVQRAW